MFEDQSYEKILERMLARIPNQIDKREGSIIIHALAPAAAELQQAYINMDVILDETFADTASREMLIKRCAERGIVPEAATKAILKGEFNRTVPIGSRFSGETLNYIVTEAIDATAFRLQCETAGAAGHDSLGNLIPIQYIEGLQNAELTELLSPGEDEESTESLRARYFNSLETQAFGGNIADYKAKTNALNGVGGTKVYPVWNGGGTVKLVIIDSTFSAPSSELVSAIQTAIDPTQNQGQGEGIAPIGHVVTVAGVQNTTVNIQTTIAYKTGWSWEESKAYIQQEIDNYFKELSQSWADSDTLIVRVSQLETRILNAAGVLDVADTKLNGAAANLELGDDNIPVRGTINGT